MEESGCGYSVHPVTFDPDIMCERCHMSRATHLLISKEYLELCDHCTELHVEKLRYQTTAPIFRD